MTIAIALDTSSTRTGYIKGEVSGHSPLIVSNFKLNPKDKGDIGKRMVEFREALRPRLHDVDIIFMEKPIRPFSKINLTTLRILYGIAGMVEVLALDMKIPCYDVDNGKHKKLIYGQGGAKPANTVELANSWGIEATNEDEADAAGVWLYCLQAMYPKNFQHWFKIKQAAPPIPFIPKKK